MRVMWVGGEKLAAADYVRIEAHLLQCQQRCARAAVTHVRARVLM